MAAKNIVLVYRSPYQGMLGKAIKRMEGATVVEWFGDVWEELPEGEKKPAKGKQPRIGDPASRWLNKHVGFAPYGLATAWEDDDLREEENLRWATFKEWPNTVAELRRHLEKHLYVEGPNDKYIQFDKGGHALRVRTDDDEIDVAYYIFELDYAKQHMDRFAWLLYDSIKLPRKISKKGGWKPKLTNPVACVKGDGSGTTWICGENDWEGGVRLDPDLPRTGPRSIPGVRLPDLIAWLRQHGYSTTAKKKTKKNQRPTKPKDSGCPTVLINNLARSLNQIDKETIKELLATTFDLDLTSENSDVGPHAAIVSVRGYERQPFIIFDDLWAAANSDLAESILKWFTTWDPMDKVKRPSKIL